MNENKQCEEKLTVTAPIDAKSSRKERQVSKRQTNHLRIVLYSSRRLYARGWATYVTIADLVSFIRTGGTIEVQHARSKLDITEKVLKQVQAHITLEANADSASLYSAIRGAK
jgi:polyhydroxyalkanoate synthesis regulator protein